MKRKGSGESDGERVERESGERVEMFFALSHVVKSSKKNPHCTFCTKAKM